MFGQLTSFALHGKSSLSLGRITAIYTFLEFSTPTLVTNKNQLCLNTKYKLKSQFTLPHYMTIIMKK